MWPGMWMTSCTGSVRGGFWEIWKSQLSWELDSEREGSTFGARWGQTNLCATGAARDGGGGRWKSHHKKLVHLSSLCRSLLLKGNKRLRTWTKKSLRVFRVSGFLCSMYICYEHSMYVSHIRIMAMLNKIEELKVCIRYGMLCEFKNYRNS